MISTLIVDSGPLLAVANRRDPDHATCLALLQDGAYRLVLPVLCVAEVAFLLASRVGAVAEATFLAGLEDLDVRAPESGTWRTVAELVTRYADLPLGAVDASVVALAEELGTDLIATLDRRHFSVVRGLKGQPFRLLPWHGIEKGVDTVLGALQGLDVVPVALTPTPPPEQRYDSRPRR